MFLNLGNWGKNWSAKLGEEKTASIITFLFVACYFLFFEEFDEPDKDVVEKDELDIESGRPRMPSQSSKLVIEMADMDVNNFDFFCHSLASTVFFTPKGV